MIRKVHVRQEILSSNPGQPFLTKIQPKRALGTRFFFYAVLMTMAKGPGFGVPVQKTVP